MIERIFYPVGQGAFYVEKHGKRNIVYDCGSDTFKAKEYDEKKKQIIADAFSKEEEIDILFISHFHEDHVNMIPFLKDRVHIKRVVMPLLDPKEEAFLSFIYGDGDKDNYLVELIRNPEGFFGKGTLITHVDSYKEGDDVDIPFEEVPTEMLKSGTPIPFSNGCGFDWIFVPYNFKHEERRELFKEKLKKELTNKEYDDSLKILEEDPNLDLFFQHKKSGLTVLGKKVKSIYEKMPGKDPINENSMLLYSGPISEKHRYSFHCFSGKISLSQNRFCFNFDFDFYLSFCFYRDVKRVGSIYTGDANLKDDEMLRAFKASMKSFGDRVGTMQIPHHGSFNNYSKEIFDIFKRPLVCPISFGKENRYRHPSTRIIIDILRNNSFPVLVTEDIDTLCVELIDYYPFG